MSDPAWLPVRQLADQIRSGQLSSEAVVKHFLERIRQHNERINAVVLVAEEEALAKAREADASQARGEIRGPLHGVPLTLKDTWEVRGMVTTAGSPSLRSHNPARHADIVDRLEGAGAIILGKTNVPLFAGDIQSYNDVYGVTRNPRDPARTPGGSSGGAAAALAAGLTPAEVGSDIGGSIRTPAHWNGIFGHKPTQDIVSLRGHIPGPPGMESKPDLAVGGPLARTADDLEFMLQIIAGPRPAEAGYWKLDLPPSSRSTLGEMRVAHWFSDALCPIDNSLEQGYQGLARALSEQGAQISPAEHPLLDLKRIMPAYFNQLGSVLGSGLPPSQRRSFRWIARLYPLLRAFIRLTEGMDEFARGVNQPIHEWVRWREDREQMRVELESLWADFDVLLMPITPTAAIAHDHQMPLFKRRIQVNGHSRCYMDQFCWIALATLLGLPATVAPIGLDGKGLPFGVQIVAAPGADLTGIHFARLLEEAGLSRFQQPAAY